MNLGYEWVLMACKRAVGGCTAKVEFRWAWGRPGVLRFGRIECVTAVDTIDRVDAVCVSFRLYRKAHFLGVGWFLWTGTLLPAGVEFIYYNLGHGLKK